MGENGTDETERPDVPSFQALVESQRYTFWNVTGGAVVIGVAVFLLGYGVALDGGFGYGYLRSVSVSLTLIGSVGGLVLLLWGAKYHLRVWDDARRCFAVSDEAYDDLVEPILRRAYDLRRVGGEYLLALVAVAVVNWALRIPIPWAITVDPACCSKYSDPAVGAFQPRILDCSNMPFGRATSQFSRNQPSGIAGVSASGTRCFARRSSARRRR